MIIHCHHCHFLHTLIFLHGLHLSSLSVVILDIFTARKKLTHSAQILSQNYAVLAHPTAMIQKYNHCVRSFVSHQNFAPVDLWKECWRIIYQNKRPLKEHERRYNVSQVLEAAATIPRAEDGNLKRKDIVNCCRGDLHEKRSRDLTQYWLLTAFTIR